MLQYCKEPCNNNLRVSNIRVSNRTLIYNVCPKSALTWPSRLSRLDIDIYAGFTGVELTASSRTGACLRYRQQGRPVSALGDA